MRSQIKIFALILAILVLLISCGPSEGDNYFHRLTLQEVTVLKTGKYNYLVKLIKPLKEKKETGSLLKPIILIEKDGDVDKSDSTSTGVLVSWHENKLDKESNKILNYWHLRVVRTENFDLIFTQAQ